MDEIINNKNYNGDLEDKPVLKIMNMLDNNIAVETILMFIECDYGINKLCRSYSYDLKKMQTILDELLLYMESYHEFDDIDDKFYNLAELVLLLIKLGAKCARDLSYSKLIQDFNFDINYRDKNNVLLVHHDGLDTYEYIFKCMSVDLYRFKYFRYLKDNNPNYLHNKFHILFDIILSNRNYCDPYNANQIVNSYDNIFGLDYKFTKEMTLKELILNKNLMLLYQQTELYELYKRITQLLLAINQLKKNKLKEVVF